MNVLILMAGDHNAPIHDENYPVCLSEVNDKMVIEHLIENCSSLENAHITCLIREEDNKQYHLENIIHLVNPNVSVIKIRNKTQGALCTALLAISKISLDKSLLILNGNDLIKKNFQTVIDDFIAKQLDAGTIIFPSIHPRYSFVRINEAGFVLEAAEKKPISHFATTGFYWYAKAHDFIEGAKNMLRKNDHHEGIFYICPIFNELILQHKKIGTYLIEKHLYLPLKSGHQLTQAQFITEAYR